MTAVNSEHGDRRRLVGSVDSADGVNSLRHNHVSNDVMVNRRSDGVSDRRDLDTNTYTELLRGSVPCPTCRGIGNIPKEQEGQLVALIPLKDERLKPRRTYLYVCLTVFLCLTAAGLLLFFMFPRNVLVTSNKPFLFPQNLSISVPNQKVNFRITNPINISNQNYFPVTVSQIVMTVLFRTKVITTGHSNSTVTVPIRDEISSFVESDIKFNKFNDFGYMASLCSDNNRWFHEFVMVFQFTVNYSYLGHTEMTSLMTYQEVSCGNDTAPIISTLIPVSTTTPPVTTTTATTTQHHTTKPGLH